MYVYVYINIIPHGSMWIRDNTSCSSLEIQSARCNLPFIFLSKYVYTHPINLPFISFDVQICIPTPSSPFARRGARNREEQLEWDVREKCDGWLAAVRTQETSCSSDSRFRRKLSETTAHRLQGTQRPHMLWLTSWGWFSLTTEFVVVPLARGEPAERLQRKACVNCGVR